MDGHASADARLVGLVERVRAVAGAHFDVVGLGECGVDEVWRLPAPLASGGKGHAVERLQLGGGQVATAMVAARRLGAWAAFVGRVGDDAAGTFVLEGLREEGVDASNVARVAGARTRSALLLVDPSGERTIVEDVDERLSGPVGVLPRGRVLHVDATHPHEAVRAARAAHADGAVVSLDLDRLHGPSEAPAHDAHGAERPTPAVAELIAAVDVCVTSQALPPVLLSPDDERRMRPWSDDTLLAGLGVLAQLARPGAVIGCTLGPDGAAAIDAHGRLVRAPAFDVRVVDTTACGDVFHAALVVALLEGITVLQRALRFACAAASLKCRDLGRRGCPHRFELDSLLLEEHG